MNNSFTLHVMLAEQPCSGYTPGERDGGVLLPQSASEHMTGTEATNALLTCFLPRPKKEAKLNVLFVCLFVCLFVMLTYCLFLFEHILFIH